MLDDIDYSALSAQEPAARPAPKAGVSDRSVVKKSEKKKLDVQAIEEKTKTLEESVGAPEIPDPLAQYGLPAIGILGGLAAAYGAWKKGEKNASYPETSVPADNKGAAAAKSVEQNVEQSLASQADRLAQLKERVLAGKQAGLGSPVQTQPTYNVPTADVPQIAAQPSAPVQPPAQPAPGPIQRQPIPETVGAPPFAAPAPKAPVPPTTSVTEAVTAGQSPNQAIQATIAKEIDSAGGLRTGSGLPAVAGTGEQRLRSPRGGVYESAAKVPVGQAFVPGMGPGTNTVRQALGEEGYQQLVRQLGRPIGSDAEAKQLLKEFAENRVGPPVTREMRKSLGVAPLPNTPGIAMKAAKVAGVGGAILAMADLARAAQQTKEGEYKEAAKTVAPIIDPTGLSTAALEPQSTAQMLTSVSPVMGILSQLFGSKIQEKQKSKR